MVTKLLIMIDVVYYMDLDKKTFFDGTCINAGSLKSRISITFN